ncbi:hypothetical protein MPSEU_000671800 [Mayamaea pseudoterrestris]|nr:hypothetical protein MPSEU_000671800 [Mayamaea pseudoterrestris]
MPYDNVNVAKENEKVPCQGKEQLVSILRAAGINVAANDSSVCASLPTWKEVEELYGSEPRILGLETCQRYRDMIQQAQQAKRQDNVTVYPMPRVAGLQNCGTTAFADTLQHNLVVDPTIHSDSPRAYNVPWRKHTPIQFKDFVTSDSYDWQEDKELVLPIVIARDPYRWMASMCEMNYNVNWVFSNRHCPNLVAYPEQNMESAPLENVPVVFALNEPTLKVDVQYPSLAHMWSTFNRDYLEYDAPRLMIRYEDTLFHGEKVFEAIQDCVGGMPSRYISFQPYVWNAKEGSADLVGALTKNGRQQGRYSEMIAEDIDYAIQHLDPELMELLHYVNPTQIPADSYAAEDLRNREN